MVDQNGVEVGEHFHIEDNDKRQHQTSVSPVDLQGTSDDRGLTKTVPKGSSSSIGVPLSYRDLKQTKEKPSQQSSQEINDKYFLSTFPSETMLTDLFSLHEQYFEIQEKEFLTSSTNVKGRLTENIGFWETIGANPEILKILREGYRIPFFESPQESFSKNNISVLKNMEFVEEAVFELLKSNRVVQTPFKPWIVSPLSVSTNKLGKKRLILDLRILNKFLWKQKYVLKIGKLRQSILKKIPFVLSLIYQKGIITSIFFSGHQTFLGFSIKGKYYCFTVIPFGLSSAPYIFTKVLREMVKYWRSHCIKIVMFLDDGWGTNSNRHLCSADAVFV